MKKLPFLHYTSLQPMDVIIKDKISPLRLHLSTLSIFHIEYIFTVLSIFWGLAYVWTPFTFDFAIFLIWQFKATFFSPVQISNKFM